MSEHTFKVPDVVPPATTPLITAANSMRNCCRLVGGIAAKPSPRSTAFPEHGLAAASGTQSTPMSPTLTSECKSGNSPEPKHIPGPPRLVLPTPPPPTLVFPTCTPHPPPVPGMPDPATYPFGWRDDPYVGK